MCKEKKEGDRRFPHHYSPHPVIFIKKINRGLFSFQVRLGEVRVKIAMQGYDRVKVTTSPPPFLIFKEIREGRQSF